MILLKVYSKGLGTFPFECDAPGPVYVKRVALRLPTKRVNIKARLPQTVERAGHVESVKPHKRPTVQIASYPSRLPGLEKLLEAAVFEASDHPIGV